MRVFFSDFYQQEFGVRLPNTLIAPMGGNHAIYIDSDEWKDFSEAVYEKVCLSIDEFERYKVMIQKDQKKFVDVCTRIGSGVTSETSVTQLQNWHTEYMQIYQEFFNTAIWIPFTTEPLISERATTALKDVLQRNGQEEKFQAYFDAIFSPEQKNAVVQEREDLLQIVFAATTEQLSEQEIQQRIQSHAEKYEWMPCYDVYDTPWDVEYFNQALDDAQKTEWRQELQELREFDSRAQAFSQFMKTVECMDHEKTVFRIAHEIVFIKDERDDHRRQGSYAIQPLFQEIGKRMGGLSIREVSHLLHDEINDFFNSGVVPDLRTIQERVNGYVLMRKNDTESISIFSGKQAQEILQQELSHLQEQERQEVQGTTGASGSCTGPARVVFTKHDLRKILDGDIMVTVTTHPDFVPAMRRCTAIVTDEGGITCHAAIVSRELGIPCVVGTKYGTATFRDGEELDVDADDGVVKRKR